MVTIHGTKQKEETYGAIAAAWDDADIGAEITIIQPNDLGGKSLEKTLLHHFPTATADSKNKSRFITLIKTADDPEILPQWRDHTILRYIPETGFYAMPGIFGWQKIDQGSKILTQYLQNLQGVGADFGCGYGYLSHYALTNNAAINKLYAFDIEAKSVQACRKNIHDPRAIIDQSDCTKPLPTLPPLDFIIMNPPFHEGSKQDHTLGHDFIINAAHHLKQNGHLYMVANAYLPYEKILHDHFDRVEKCHEGQGFKIFRT